MSYTDLPPNLRKLIESELLTDRQREVVHDEADGMSIRYTARRLGITTSTVQGHRTAAHDRLRHALEHQAKGEAA